MKNLFNTPEERKDRLNEITIVVLVVAMMTVLILDLVKN